MYEFERRLANDGRHGRRRGVRGRVVVAGESHGLRELRVAVLGGRFVQRLLPAFHGGAVVARRTGARRQAPEAGRAVGAARDQYDFVLHAARRVIDVLAGAGGHREDAARVARDVADVGSRAGQPQARATPVRLDGDGAARQEDDAARAAAAPRARRAHHFERVALGVLRGLRAPSLCFFGGRRRCRLFRGRRRHARPSGRRRRDRGRRAAERRVYARGRLRRGDGSGDGRRPPERRVHARHRLYGLDLGRGPVVGRRREGLARRAGDGPHHLARQLLVHVAVVVHDLEAAILVLLEELALVNLAAAPESGFDGHARAERCVRLVERLLGRLGALLRRRGRRGRGRSWSCGFGADERGGHAELALSVVVEHAERAVVVQRRDLARVVRALSPIIRLDGGADRK